MKNIKVVSALVLMLCISLVFSVALAANPSMPMWEHIADGEPHVFGDRVYIFGSHDTGMKPYQYCGENYVVWSAPVDDLTDWSYSTYPNIDCGEGGGGAASDGCQGPDGRFYTYVVMDYPAANVNFMCTVWVCDTPDGEYEFVSVLKNPDGTDADRYFDPAVLVDDDGRVYLYGGSSMVWELDPTDMYTVIGKYNLEGDGIKNFAEGASIRVVRDGDKKMYCLVYDGARKNNPSMVPQTVNGAKAGYRGMLEYAYSETPIGPWTYGGTIIDNGGVPLSSGDDSGYFIAPEHMMGGRKSSNYGDYYLGTRRSYYDGNNHGGIECVNGQWYVFYHRMSNNDEYSRQAMIEPLNVRIEGNDLIIEQAEYTSQGAEINGLNPEKTYEAAIACWMTNGAYAATRIAQDELSSVVNIHNSAVVGYKYYNFEAANYTLNLGVKALGIPGTIVVKLDDPNGAEVARIAVPAEASEEFVTMTADLGAVEGKHAVFFNFYAESEQAFCEINTLSFSK